MIITQQHRISFDWSLGATWPFCHYHHGMKAFCSTQLHYLWTKVFVLHVYISTMKFPIRDELCLDVQWTNYHGLVKCCFKIEQMSIVVSKTSIGCNFLETYFWSHTITTSWLTYLMAEFDTRNHKPVLVNVSQNHVKICRVLREIH